MHAHSSQKSSFAKGCFYAKELQSISGYNFRYCLLLSPSHICFVSADHMKNSIVSGFQLHSLEITKMENCSEPKLTNHDLIDATNCQLNRGSGDFGCSHYRRRCKIRAPCCDEVFHCRHCHNEIKDSLELNPTDRHDMPRHQLSRVICSLCDMEQDVQQNCEHCGVCLGKYFCSKCKFFDDDVTKSQYHCNKCGICRTGGKENSFHCDKCGCCYSMVMEDSHKCIEGAMHHNCPVCFEFIFDTTKEITVLPCGHTIHLECVIEMRKHYRYSCPVCCKSYCDMSRVWEKLDEEVASTPMPEMYQNKMVWILCNDCGETSEVNFHILANKCPCCNSYNTRETRGAPASCSSRFEEESTQVD